MAYENESAALQWRPRIAKWMKRPLLHKLRSAGGKVRTGMHRIEDFVFERRWGLDCSGYIENRKIETIHAAALPHSRAYQAATCAAIRELIDEVKKTGIVFDHFIDLGSGKGKVCFYAAIRYRFRKIIGVEFSGPLVEIARNNAVRFGADNIFFVNADAATFPLPPGDNLVFLFNPFGESILKKFLEGNMDRFRQSRSVIAYCNDQHRLCLARAGFVTLFRNQDTQASVHQYHVG